MRHLSSNSLRFNVNFIIKTSVLLNMVLRKKVSLFNGATRLFIVCMLNFVLVFQCHALKRYYRPIDKK